MAAWAVGARDAPMRTLMHARAALQLAGRGISCKYSGTGGGWQARVSYEQQLAPEPEGGTKLWARGWEQRQAIVRWRIEARERAARHRVPTQGEPHREVLLGGEGAAHVISQEGRRNGCGTGWEGGWQCRRGPLLTLTVEAAAARRRRWALQEHMWQEREDKGRAPGLFRSGK